MPKFGRSDKKWRAEILLQRARQVIHGTKIKRKCRWKKSKMFRDARQTWISIQAQHFPGAVATISVKKTLQTSRLPYRGGGLQEYNFCKKWPKLEKCKF